MNQLREKVVTFVMNACDLITQGEILTLELRLSRPTHPLAQTITLNPEETLLLLALIKGFLEGKTS